MTTSSVWSPSVVPVEHRRVRHVRVLALGCVAFVLAWIVLAQLAPTDRFVLVAPRATTGFEVFLALLQFFAALVLILFPDEHLRPRLRWVAMGLCVLGLGGLGTVTSSQLPIGSTTSVSPCTVRS